MPTPQLYLIAHKVRGQPAFDIAIQMTMGDDFCRECMAPIRAALNKLNTGIIWICVFCGEYNEPSHTACQCCNGG